MEFRKYQHLERYDTSEVENIQLGHCFVFPKLDGTNGSLWMSEGLVKAGSRNRELSLEKDNAGFLQWAIEQERIYLLLKNNPGITLFGEWLVPHSLKTYKDEAWKRFYVFDVMDENGNYIHYDVYKILLEDNGIDYIPPICEANNASYEQFINQLEKNVFMIEDGKGHGEGIVIKNYSFVNKFGRTNWAKIVTNEFKEKHAKAMGGHDIKGKKLVEEEIAKEYVTKSLCEKVYAKIENDGGFNSKRIPQLLNTVYYDIVKEECWNFVKKHKNPTINFKTLQHFVFAKVKENLPKIF